MLCLRMKMASIILSTKLCIIQFYAKVLAFVKSDLTSHPQVAIFLRGILSKYLPEKLKAWDGGWGGGKNMYLRKCLSILHEILYCIDSMQ